MVVLGGRMYTVHQPCFARLLKEVDMGQLGPSLPEEKTNERKKKMTWAKLIKQKSAQHASCHMTPAIDAFLYMDLPRNGDNIMNPRPFCLSKSTMKMLKY